MINQDFHRKSFITKEVRRCIFSLEFRTHTIEEATEIFKVRSLTVRNKELKVYNFIIENVRDV